MATPPITDIVPKAVEFTPKGLVATYDVTYKGGAKSVLTIRSVNVIETGKLAQPLVDMLAKRGFRKGA